MAITTGILRGGSNSHQTTSEEANALATDFVGEGVVGSVGNSSGVAPATGGFAVNAQGTPDMTVAVSSGVAYVTGTPTSQNSQTLRVKNSGSTNATISANSSGSTKYDWVYIKLDPTNMADPNSAADNVATIVVSRSSSPSTDDGTPPTYEYPLAVVTVANGASSITNGNIRDVRSQVPLNTGTSNASDGWVSAGEAWSVSTGYNKGNKEYDITISGDKTSKYSAGMRIKLTRGITPPTQCADLESSSSQFGSKSSPTGISFTDDFSCEAWVKLESYVSATIVSRFDGSNGWAFQVDSTGRLVMYGDGTNTLTWTTAQSVPLGVWVHVAGTMDMSGNTSSTNKFFINGVDVPATGNGGTGTSLTQAGNLQVGAANSTAFFDGKVSDVRVWSAIRTGTQIRDNMNQQLVGSETNLVAYFKLAGNLNDSTSNANNLTGSGGAVATDTDNPMNATEYAIIQKVSYSAPNTTMTVFSGIGYNIPNMTLSTPYYSTHKVPFGFPSGRTRWSVVQLQKADGTQSSPVASTWYNAGTPQLSIPTGRWVPGYEAVIFADGPSSASIFSTLSTANNTESDPTMTTRFYSSTSDILGTANRQMRQPLELTSQTVYYLNIKTDIASHVTINFFNGASGGTQVMYAENAYA